MQLEFKQVVPIDIFMKYTIFKRLLHPDVFPRILSAFGKYTYQYLITLFFRSGH
jgi:hypothetical protein